MAEYEKKSVKKGNPVPAEENNPTFLVASDLDGTLMRSNSRLSEYSKNVLQRAIRRGIEFLPISGRSYRSAYDIIKDIDGIHPDNTIAFGDSNNDRAMIEYAAWGIAVENSMEELKDAADLIVASNEEDGPAKYIEQRFLFGRKVHDSMLY